MTRSIVICSCSKFTFNVIVTNSLSSDELDDEINIERVFEADSLLIYVYYTHVAKLISFMSITFDKACSVYVYYTHVVELVSFVSTTCM